MVAIPPDPSTPAESTIHRSGGADGQALQATAERVWCVGLHQQVEVIALDGELDDAKPLTGGRRERLADGGEDAFAAERWDPGRRPQSGVRGMPRVVSTARTVRDTAPTWSGLPSCAGPPATPASHRELELSRTPAHLDWCSIYTSLASVSM
jgi:hypothetical protein